MGTFKLLTAINPKIQKSVEFGYLTAVLHLAPGDLSGFQVCPKATTGCLAACLNTAGRGGIVPGSDGRLQHHEIVSGTRTNTLQQARIRRTRWYFTDRETFLQTLVADIAKLERMAAKMGLKAAVRLNGTSDIPWERVAVTLAKPGATVTKPNVMAWFPAVQFYDYTKRANRRDLPSNYTLTFSLAEGNDNEAQAALRNGMNVAAVFHNVPATYRLPLTRDRGVYGAGFIETHGWVGKVKEYPVIDGDKHDLRFLDKRGVIVGLTAKGNAKGDKSGFVR